MADGFVGDSESSVYRRMKLRLDQGMLNDDGASLDETGGCSDEDDGETEVNV